LERENPIIAGWQRSKRPIASFLHRATGTPRDLEAHYPAQGARSVLYATVDWDAVQLRERLERVASRISMNKSIQTGPDAAPRGKAGKPRARRESLARPTQFAYPRGINSCHLRFSRKGQKLAEAMQAFAAPLLLPKLNARAERTGGNRYDDLTTFEESLDILLRDPNF
jgi:hypothetical protein